MACQPVLSNRQVIGRPQRLLQAAEYKAVFTTASARSRDAFMRIYAIHNNKPHARLGLAVSRKVSAKAVQRNRIKRLIRESFRQQHDLQGLDVVVVAQPNVVDKSNQEIFQILDKHWTRITVQCAK